MACEILNQHRKFIEYSLLASQIYFYFDPCDCFDVALCACAICRVIFAHRRPSASNLPCASRWQTRPSSCPFLTSPSSASWRKDEPSQVQLSLSAFFPSSLWNLILFCTTIIFQAVVALAKKCMTQSWRWILSITVLARDFIAICHDFCY